MIGIINNTLSSNFLKVTSECKTYQNAEQIVTVDCRGTAWLDSSSTTVPENSQVCATCYQQVAERQASLHNLYQSRWANGAKVDIPESFDNELQRIMAEMENCIVACKSCVYDDLSQTSNFSYDATCKNNVINVTEFTNGVVADLINEVSQSSGFGQALITAVGGGDAQNFESQIQNRLEAAVNLDILNSVLATMSNRQSIQLTGNDSFASGLTQTASFTGVAELFSNTEIATNIISDQQYAVAQEIIDDKSVIGPAGEFLKDASITFAQFVETTSGQVLRYGLWAVTGILFFLTIYALWNALRGTRTLTVTSSIEVPA